MLPWSRETVLEDGVMKLMDRLSFAGSIATTDRLVRFCTKEVGIDLCETIKMITVNPAKVMGLKQKGRIKNGVWKTGKGNVFGVSVSASLQTPIIFHRSLPTGLKTRGYLTSRLSDDNFLTNIRT